MKKFKIKLLITSLLISSCFLLSAQIFEAENATLAGGAEKLANASSSGGFYVAQKDGNLTFDLSLTEEGFYNISIYAASPGGNKVNKFSIDGMNVDFSLSLNSNYVLQKVVSSLKLKPGKHQVKITKSWGWIDIGCIRFEKVTDWKRFDISNTPVTPNPTDQSL